jgi:tannase/feruloyl esterase
VRARRTFLTAAIAAIASASVSIGVRGQTAAAPAGPAAQKCAALVGAKGLPNATTVVASAVLNPSSPPQPAAGPFAPPTPALPEHCDLSGKMNERDGANGQRYAINFRLRMPTTWNGRFFFQGGGGSNGDVGNALGILQGRQPNVALALGYAVVSQDAGHDNARNSDPMRGGAVAFGTDPQARLDLGYNSYDQVTQAAKALIAKYYGRPATKSYYVGCSEGGREGMVVSQRFPTHFDGVLACAPGFRLPQAAVAEAWDSQAFAAVARSAKLVDRNNQPFLNRTFSDEDLRLVSNAVLQACDGLDGAKDGLIQDFPNCTTKAVESWLSIMTCKGAKDAGCVSPDQVAALKKVFDGARTSRGELAYAPWAWDAGIGGKMADAYNQGWRIWKIGAFNGESNSAINLTLGASALPLVFVTPPVPVAMANGGAAAYSFGFDVDAYRTALGGKTTTFGQSSLEFMKADSTDLSAFKSHGGKLVIVHGVSDPVFSILDTIDWWNGVNRASGGRASDVVRLFAVPGMNHCAGGPATDQFDAFSALVAWVEKGVAPERIVATAGPATPWPGRTRPLCAYPKQARYDGTGNLQNAGSFVCR